MTTNLMTARLADPEPIGGDFVDRRRAFDLAFALAALPALAVAAGVLHCLNARFNRGPLLEEEARMGQHRRPFRALRFRTAPAAEAPPTPLGAFVRRHRIDALPQLINVLRGEMSIIGPRAEALRRAAVYCAVVPGYASRHLVRPGITGLAQVSGGSTRGFAEPSAMVRLDLAYIRSRTVRIDALILLASARLALAGRCPEAGGAGSSRSPATPTSRDSGELCPWLS